MYPLLPGTSSYTLGFRLFSSDFQQPQRSVRKDDQTIYKQIAQTGGAEYDHGPLFYPGCLAVGIVKLDLL